MSKHRRLPTRRIFIIRRILVVASALFMVVSIWLSVTTAARNSHPTAIAQAQPTATPTTTTSPTRSATPQESAQQQAEREQLAAQQAPISKEEHDQIYQAALKTAQASGVTPTKMTYCVNSRGNVDSLDGFANTIYRSLNDTQGWPRAGVVFTQGDESTCTITITLAQAEEVPSFSSYCSTEYSCRVGDDVIINNTRWHHGVDHWLENGKTLAQYRSMVLNHEVGHALGHMDNETPCGGEGQAAPLMQEQSMFLHECTPNQYPLDSELWSTFQGEAA